RAGVGRCAGPASGGAPVARYAVHWHQVSGGRSERPKSSIKSIALAMLIGLGDVHRAGRCPWGWAMSIGGHRPLGRPLTPMDPRALIEARQGPSYRHAPYM